jgi:hypothetical protein
MPSLDPAARAALLGPLHHPCPACRMEYVRHYCRTCDEFFTTCGCGAQPEADQHVNAHRVYLWTLAGVIAVPDFDVFGDAERRP